MSKSEYKKQEPKDRLANRHIAKLLSRLQPLNLPEIAISEIKRQMWYLAEDLKSAYKGEVK